MVEKLVDFKNLLTLLESYLIKNWFTQQTARHVSIEIAIVVLAGPHA